ncbi:DUF4157 domain-containing protein [Massilia antarctica]|uniref:DUF4157 domain-containing protein n=1 Tax=Massilia antarctica TaxID=2765360 RepID=A0AA49A9P8_9BURK|nr:DUF4157 domain-containing protein [Massilia antarctica]QPI50870.1 DUF4157 domain-containing protein [Massilia antarctica]
MTIHADKTPENHMRPMNRGATQQTGASAPALQFMDNRAQAGVHRTLQDLANNSARVGQLRSFQPSGHMKDEEKHPAILAKRNRNGLPEKLQSGMEDLSGYAMDDVKVHYNSERPGTLQAHAFAQGTEIHVAPGQEAYLPHEAWHVVQQKQGRVPANSQMKGAGPVNTDRALEKEADVMGEKARSLPLVERSHAPLQGRFQAGGVIQLGTNEERAALANGFMQQVNTLYLGRIVGASTLRNNKTGEIATLAPGSVIVYQGNLRDNFNKGLRTVMKDHVFCAAVADATGTVHGNPAQWRRGWVVYEHIETDSAGSAVLQAAAPAGSVALQVLGYLQQAAQGGHLPPRVANRRDAAPRAIKAWAEKTRNPLTEQMPLADLGLTAVDLDNIAGNAYGIIDPNGDLGLDRAAHNSAFFIEAQRFLDMNAAAMPGTLAKDHELRDAKVGGERARNGRAWLESYAGKNFNDAEMIAITGAQVTNIFINRNAPTWAAYRQNTVHQQQDRQFGAAQANWSASQTIRGKGEDALIDRMTAGGAGEYYLFHGTSKANVYNISKSGFDPEFVNYTFIKGYGKTGYGTAFTDQFAKALAYAPPEKIAGVNGEPATYKHYVLVARVFAGRTHQVGDRARRTRGNLEMTQHNINYPEATGNKMRAQGQDMPHLGRASDTVATSYANDTPLHSTVQDREFRLSLNEDGELAAEDLVYRDTSLTVPDAIQMYPAYIIESEIPAENMRTGRRTIAQ